MNDPIKTQFKYDEAEDKVLLTNSQDIEPLLNLNKKEFNGDAQFGSPGKDMRKVASIPLIIIEKWKRELGVDVMNKDHMPKVKKLLNDPEWRYLRTHESNL